MKLNPSGISDPKEMIVRLVLSLVLFVGVAQAKKAILDQLVYPPGKMRSFIQQNPNDAANGIKAMAEILIGSIVGSVTSFSEGSESGAFMLPEPDEDEDVWL